jgi:hypothetical protein
MTQLPSEPWDHDVLLTRQLRQLLVRLRFLVTMDDEQAARHALLPDELATLLPPEDRDVTSRAYVQRMLTQLESDPLSTAVMADVMTRWRQSLERVRARFDWAQFPPAVRRRALGRADYLLAKAAESGLVLRDAKNHVWKLTLNGLETLKR